MRDMVKDSDFQKSVNTLDAKMKAIGIPTIQFKVQHYFTPGVYTRVLHIPKGAFIIGKYHKTEHPYIVAMGTITVATDEGRETLNAGDCGITPENTRRVGYAHTDCVWVTTHANPDNENLEQIEARIIDATKEVTTEEIEKAKSQLNLIKIVKCLSSQQEA